MWILSISLTKEGLNKYIKLLCEMTWVAPSVIWPHLFLLTKKCQKSRKIEVLTLNEKISLSSEQLEELQWNFQERRDLILKVTQKTRLHSLSRRYKFGTSYNYCKNLNWKKPFQDFQFWVQDKFFVSVHFCCFWILSYHNCQNFEVRERFPRYPSFLFWV